VRARDLFAGAAAAVVFCSATFALRAAEPDVETSVYESRVAPGDPISLRIRLRGAAASSEPDLTPLARDFEVLDVHQSHHTSIINGVRDESVDYAVALAARREGELVIPALPVGDTATDPVPIQVSARAGDVAERDDESQAPVSVALLEAHVDRSDPYEQERVVLRIDLYASGDILEGALSSPEIPGAVVESIGEDRQLEKDIGGKRYGGIERTYTIVPEASGDLVVSAIRFEGRVRVPTPQPQRRRLGGGYGHSLLEDFFANSPMPGGLFEGFFGGASRLVAITSNPVTLRVRPRPEGAAGQWWLPAREVSLSESWDPAAAAVRVGEPITRRIEMRADGVSPAQLPVLQTGDVDGVKQYAEAPEATETVRGTVRIDETTLIPTQAGSVTLPAIEVAWWDTKADALRKATLPARNIEVLAAAAVGDTRVGASPAPAPATAASDPAQSPVASAVGPRLDARALAALAAVAAIAIFLLGVFVARYRHRPGQLADAESPTPGTRRSAERALRRACARKDVAGADAAVRTLRRVLGADSPILCDARLAQEIARLHAVRYSTQREAWPGASLWKAWRQARRTRRPATAAAALPPLYPAP
jgi:hypothetical protein